MWTSIAITNYSNADEVLTQEMLTSPNITSAYDFIRKNPNSSDYTKAVDRLIALSKQNLPAEFYVETSVVDEENFYFLPATVQRLNKTTFLMDIKGKKYKSFLIFKTKKEQVLGTAIDCSNKSVAIYSLTKIDGETENKQVFGNPAYMGYRPIPPGSVFEHFSNFLCDSMGIAPLVSKSELKNNDWLFAFNNNANSKIYVNPKLTKRYEKNPEVIAKVVFAEPLKTAYLDEASDFVVQRYKINCVANTADIDEEFWSNDLKLVAKLTAYSKTSKQSIQPNSIASLAYKEACSGKIRLELEEAKRKQPEAEDQLRLIQQTVSALPQSTIATQTGKRVALVVGNSNYKVRPLKNPRNDADDISRALRSSGFEVIDLRDATLTQMRTGVRQFGDLLINNDVGLVYYSGHGVEVKGRNYFIPVNADIMREDEIADQGLDVSLILEKMNTAGKGVNILIVDACRDDPFGRSFRSASRGLAQMDAPKGTIIAYATSPGKVASDGDPKERNSPYTKNLVKAMQQPNLPIEQVFKEVRRAVQEETKNQQIPWENTSLSGDFFFRVQK